MKLVFIAGKFSGENAWEIACNVHEAEAVALRVAKLGGMPVVPHSLGRSMFGTLPEAFWRAGCLALLAKCDGIVLLPSWSSSAGANAESNFANERGIRRWGIGHLDSADFVRWLTYPAERGAVDQGCNRSEQGGAQMIGQLLCRLGWHRWWVAVLYAPARCKRCGVRK